MMPLPACKGTHGPYAYAKFPDNRFSRSRVNHVWQTDGQKAIESIILGFCFLQSLKKGKLLIFSYAHIENRALGISHLSYVKRPAMGFCDSSGLVSGRSQSKW